MKYIVDEEEEGSMVQACRNINMHGSRPINVQSISLKNVTKRDSRNTRVSMF